MPLQRLGTNLEKQKRASDVKGIESLQPDDKLRIKEIRDFECYSFSQRKECTCLAGLHKLDSHESPTLARTGWSRCQSMPKALITRYDQTIDIVLDPTHVKVEDGHCSD